MLTVTPEPRPASCGCSLVAPPPPLHLWRRHSPSSRGVAAKSPLSRTKVAAGSGRGWSAPGGKKTRIRATVSLGRDGMAVRGEGGASSFAACLRPVTLDHASLSRRSTVPIPNRDDTSNLRPSLRSFHILHDKISGGGGGGGHPTSGVQQIPRFF